MEDAKVTLKITVSRARLGYNHLVGVVKKKKTPPEGNLKKVRGWEGGGKALAKSPWLQLRFVALAISSGL